jgi:outer membrane biosynthesis protein TonB
MKPQSKSQHKWASLFATAGVILAMGQATFRAQADEWDKKTVLTINQPMQVRETLLQPGQYVFKLLDSNSDRHIVQIFNADQSHLINTILAVPNYRLQPTGGSRFAMWETPAGSVNALRAWFYPGDNYGQEFPYPKHLQQIALLSPVPLPPPPVVQPEPAPAPPQAEQPAPAEPPAQPEVAQEPPAEGPQPAELAENTPVPAPPEQAAQPSSTPSTLPKTASPYPATGLAGLVLVSFGALLRRAYSA